MSISMPSYEELLGAYKKVKRGRKKLSNSKFRKFKAAQNNSLGKFFEKQNSQSQEKLLTKMVGQLNSGKYKLHKYRCVVLPKKVKGFRTILVPNPEDRIVFSAIGEKMGSHFIPQINEHCVFGCGKRSDFPNLRSVVLEVQRCSKQYPFVLKIDIKKFFPSVSKTKLLRILKPLLDTNVYEIVESSINNEIEYIFDPKLSENDRVEAMGLAKKGLPQGCAYSPLLANCYALPLDKTIRELKLPSFRYLDDMIVFTNSEDEARSVFEVLRGVTEKIEVEMHGIGADRSKTYIQKTTEAFEYLGIDILPSGECKIPLSKMINEFELITKNIVSQETLNKFGAERVVTVLTRHIKGWRAYYSMNFPTAYADLSKNYSDFNKRLDKHYKTRTGFRKQLRELGFDIHKTKELYEKYFFL